MKNIILILVLICSQASVSQTIDFLKDFDTNKRITYSFIREGYPGVLTDTTSQFDAFKGSVEVSIDSIILSPVDSVKYYYLSIRKVGIKTILKINRIVSKQNIDIVYKRILKEYLTINFRSGMHRISGWLIPDSVIATPLCPNEPASTIYYRYPYYFRYYSFPTTDTLDFQADTLVLHDRWTDCLDAGCTWEFIISATGGLEKITTDIFNWFDWSPVDQYIKTGVTTSISEKRSAYSYYLYQNYPNPFNPMTNIRFFVPKNEFVEISIFNLLGQSIKSFGKKKYVRGTHQIIFDGRLLSSGVYFVKMEADIFTDTKKIVLIK